MRLRRAGFSLIEFITVLAIMVILMALLFPALMNARERARITRARGEVMALEQAWLAYRLAYGEFPSFFSMTPEAVAVLGGRDPVGNPNGIAFMEFDNRHYNEGFNDPWWRRGESPRYYRLEFERLDVETTWKYQTRVHCANMVRARY